MSKDLYVSNLLDVYGDYLTEKQKNYTYQYYNEDLSLSEIAENEGITRQGVCDQIKRAESSLIALESKCNYCKKFLELKNLANEYKMGKTKDIKKILNIIENL